MERWGMCKGSQCWPVLQDVIRIDWNGSVWNGNIPFHRCPQRVRLPPWVSEGLGTPSHELFWRQWLQQVAGEAIVEIRMCFPLGSPPGKDRKILVLSQLPWLFFFFHPSGSESLVRYAKNPTYWMGVCLVCEATWIYTYHIHMETGFKQEGMNCSRP